jgi:pseudouridine-5'-phosphate glycosidase
MDIRAEVAEALDEGEPVVALESSFFAQGLPAPLNEETALALEAAVRAGGAVPASIAIMDGRVRVGLNEEEIAELARAPEVAKVGTRDLGLVLGQWRLGATTVSGSMACADIAGIPLLATGGIGGVHRGGQDSLDISADLTELASTPVAVVCSGAKSILDLARTLEVLETSGVPVIGYGTAAFPAFFARESGLGLEARAETPEEVATILAAHWGLGIQGGLVIANPVPKAAAIEPDRLEGWVAQALAEAAGQGVTGGALTPYLLTRLAEISKGKTLKANVALLKDNARLAAEIAVALAELKAS